MLAAMAALLLLPPAANGQEEEPPSRLSFDGFGTLGLVYSTERRADFVWKTTRPSGPGRSAAVSPVTDSVLAGQATLQITSKLSAMVQVMAEQTADDDYVPHLEWANLRYDFTPDASVRLGRIALPTFMISEHRKVSFANPWVRPPVELYGMVQTFTLDGVGGTYRRHAGDWTTTLDGSFGRTKADLPEGLGKVEAEKLWNVNATFQRGGFTGRLAFSRADLYLRAFAPLFDAFRSFGPEGEAIAARYEIDGKPFPLVSMGAEYDPGRWFVLAEAAWLDFDSALGERAAGYVSGGRRWGSFTSYATYSRSELLSDSTVAGLSLSNLPPEVAPIAAALDAGLNEFLRTAAPVQQNLAVGGRWDFRPGMALKLQVDLIDVLGDSPGTFVNPEPGFEPGDSAQLVSLATVFVF